MMMYKKMIAVIGLVGLSLAVVAQNNNQSKDKVHRIVFHLSSEDTLVHKSLMKQLKNVLIAAPASKIEVVCHGPGISMLMQEKTQVLKLIQLHKTNGVTFLACENTLKEKNISKDQIIKEAGFVPSALVHIVIRQEEGWSYIKAGF